MKFLDKLVPRSHVGYVVSDVDAAVKNLQQSLHCALDAKPYLFSPDKAWLCGVPMEDLVLKIAFCHIMDGVDFEYIEPVSKNGYHFLSLLEKGDGLNHVCFVTDQYDALHKEFEEMGASIFFEADVSDPVRGHRRCFYVKVDGVPGIFEIQQVATPHVEKV